MFSKKTMSSGLPALSFLAFGLLSARLLSISSAEGGSGAWRSVPINALQLLAGARTELATKTETLCAMRLQQQEDNKVYCYSDGRCVLAKGDLNYLRGPTEEGWSCKIIGSPPCSPLFEEYSDSMCSSTCTLGGMSGNTPYSSTPPITCCSAPFTQTAAGCLHKVGTMTSWCDARTLCMDLGATFFNAKSRQHLTDEENAIRLAPFNSLPVHWVNVLNVTGSYRWGGGYGRLVETAEWRSGYGPSDTSYNRQCAIDYYFGITPYDCSRTHSVLCYADVPDCV